MAAAHGDRGIDWATAIAIAAVTGVISTQMHEAGGHGGACVALGLKPLAWGAFYFECGLRAAPPALARLVEMAGSTVNLLLAILAAALFRFTPPEAGRLRYFLWLAATVNAFVWAGYFLFSGVSGIGDWGTAEDGALQGVAHAGGWRVVLAVGGFALYWAIARIAMRALVRLTGGDGAGRADAHRLATSAYCTIGIVAILVGLLNPEGLFVLLASAAASSLGGASGLLWGQSLLPEGGSPAPFLLARSWAWIVGAAILVAAEAALLGPTLRLG